jgi:protein kinase X
MACGGDINFVDEEESMQHQPTPSTTDSISATELARHLGQVSLESSPILSAREPKFARKFSLRELEIQQTIGTGTFGRVVLTRELTSRQYFALKIMSIAEVIRLKQVEHVNNEKIILASIQHPFIVNM